MYLSIMFNESRGYNIKNSKKQTPRNVVEACFNLASDEIYSYTQDYIRDNIVGTKAPKTRINNILKYIPIYIKHCEEELDMGAYLDMDEKDSKEYDPIKYKEYCDSDRQLYTNFETLKDVMTKLLVISDIL